MALAKSKVVKKAVKPNWYRLTQQQQDQLSLDALERECGDYDRAALLVMKEVLCDLINAQMVKAAIRSAHRRSCGFAG